MCGIICNISKRAISNCGEKIITQYQDQHERGTKGFGLMEISKTKFNIKRSTEPIKALMDARFTTAPIAIFHHRQPTSTNNTINQTHPLKISHDELKFDYYILHNGVISNATELFKTHTEELGYIYSTYTEPLNKQPVGYTSYHYANEFNDSEAFAIELARYLDGKEKEINSKGSAAFIVVRVNKKTQKPETIIWGKNDRNPIQILETKSGLLIASEIQDLDAEDITDNTFEALDLKKLFQTKKMPEEIRSIVEIHDLKFKEEKRLNWNKGAKETTKESIQQNTTDDFEDFETRTKDFTPRMKAFIKMSDRIIRDIWGEVETLCMEMAYGEVSIDEITSLVSELQDTLIEKEKKANTYIRPFYDKQEEKEEEEADKEISKRTLQDTIKTDKHYDENIHY